MPALRPVEGLRAGPVSCAICGTPLGPFDPGDRPLCRNQVCHWRYEAHPRHEACRVCGRPLAVTELAIGLCGAERCRRIGLVEATWAQQRQIRARLEAEERIARERHHAEARVLRDRSAPAAGVPLPSSFPIVTIPSFDRPSARVSERRRAELRRHIREVLAEVRAGAGDGRTPDEVPNDPPALATILRAACAACRGKCCREGGEQAYLNAGAIRRYLEAHPEAGDEDVLHAYESRVPARAYRRSCIYHAPQGCRLPREMRSDTCNRYYCDGLRELRAGASDGVRRAFIAVVREDRVREGAFVSAGEVRRCRRRGPAGSE